MQQGVGKRPLPSFIGEGLILQKEKARTCTLTISYRQQEGIPGNSATHNNQRPGFGENVKGKRLKGTFTRNGLLRLKMLDPYKTVISIFMEMTADTMWRCFA